MRVNRNGREDMQERRGLRTASSRRQQANRLLLLLLTLIGAGVAAGAAQHGAPPTLSGMWRLHETSGELPGQAVRALDGRGDFPARVTIQIDQTEADVTVRRLGNSPVLLRVMAFSDNAIEHQVRGGGSLRARAEWRDRALVATGQVAVKQGILKRHVPFEEVWQIDEGGRTLTMKTTLRTPLGVKRRTQVFIRVAEDPPGAPEGHFAGDRATR